MPVPILSTKLYIPQPRVGLVQRQRLIDLLNQGAKRRLTLISAPAGYGKTTLVSAWVNQERITACWFTLDEGDNDTGRFLLYLTNALKTIGIDLEDQVLSLIQPAGSRPTGVESLENVLIPLINQIASHTVDFSVILDNYHLIEDQQVHQVINYLLMHAPPTMHFVLLTRADPPFSLSNLGLSGEMVEIRAVQLRFTPVEAENLLNQAGDLNLSRESVLRLLDKADGWPAALQMMVVALKGRQDTEEAIENLSGNQTYIADYLTDEVISRQPEPLREFLLKTSVLERLCAGLCEAVTGEADSQQILRRLKEENLFLIALDDENLWFRYNLLFASLLRHRLRESRTEQILDLYLKASKWCEQHGYLREAIDYALKGDHAMSAAQLLETNALDLIMGGEIQTFLGWVQQLPEELLLQRPGLGILYAWALLVTGEQQQAAVALLESIETEDVHTASQRDVVLAIVDAFERRSAESAALSHQALENLPEDDLFFRNLAAWNLSGALAIQGMVDEALEILQTVIQNSLVTGNYLVAIITLCRNASAEFQKGRLHRAEEIYKQALEIGKQDPSHVIPAASEALMGLGMIYREWGDLDAALQLLEESIQLSKRWREFTILDSYIGAAHILQTLGDQEGADRRMAQAGEIAAHSFRTRADDRYVASQLAYLRIRQGNLGAARRWAIERDLETCLRTDRLEPSSNLGSEVILRLELVVYARYLLNSGETSAGLHTLQLTRPLLEQMGFYQKLLEIHLLEAECRNALGEEKAARQALATAIEMAKPEGYRRIFLEEGFRIKKLLRDMATRNELNGFAIELLKEFEAEKAKRLITQSLVEPLSEREIEILKMLRSELSGPEIAEHLHISVTTLRTHTRNIYAKLGTHSRHESISKGEELGIL